MVLIGCSRTTALESTPLTDGAGDGTSTTTNSTTTTSTSTSTTSTTSTTTTSTTTTSTSPATTTTVPATLSASLHDPEALYVALYGFPGSRTLGCLGEQDVDEAVVRAAEVAAPYAEFGRRVVPTFEIIASVASAEAGADEDYSNEFPTDRFLPWLDAAAANGMHVVFDLQTGRSRFPDQAREYEALWIHPHASIALDPEWRVGPEERPGGGRIGSVDAAEVNETIDYIDGLIRTHGLPPKMCIVHQFTPSMITDKTTIRGTENVRVVIQMDGFGTLEMKQGSWGRTVRDLPDGALTGWKNFYDEDRPTPTPAETMSNDPTPHYVSYQ